MERTRGPLLFLLLFSLFNLYRSSPVTRKFIVRRYRIGPDDIERVKEKDEIINLVAALPSDTSSSDKNDRNFTPPTSLNPDARSQDTSSTSDPKYGMLPPNQMMFPPHHLPVAPPNAPSVGFHHPPPPPQHPSSGQGISHPDAPDDFKDSFDQRDSHDQLPELMTSGRLRLAPWQQPSSNIVNNRPTSEDAWIKIRQRPFFNNDNRDTDSTVALVKIEQPLLFSLEF